MLWIWKHHDGLRRNQIAARMETLAGQLMKTTDEIRP